MLRRDFRVSTALMTLLILLAGCCCLGCCGFWRPPPTVPVSCGYIRGETYKNVDKFLSSSCCPKHCVARCTDPCSGDRGSKGVVVATVQNLDYLKITTPLGRLLTEMISTRLTQHRMKVYHLRMHPTDTLIREGEGEFLQSRDVTRLTATHDVAGMVLSTYSVAADVVHVSMKMVLVDDQSVAAAWEFSLDAEDPEVADLLKQRGFGHY
ncbi:MAG: FlgO family outer membrane protein [Planctomycetota bacterium]|nr:FlgO family outer membrane protein [Planctomycetota bacterium]